MVRWFKLLGNQYLGFWILGLVLFAIQEIPYMTQDALVSLSPRLGPYLSIEKRENTMQYRFAAIMAETPNASMLNYGFMDAGFYTAAGVVPQVKYFHQTNVPLQEMLTEQRRYVEEGLCDYVVTRAPLENARYELVTQTESPAFWYETVYLYRRIV